jgi:hypothetical protein
MRGKTMLKQPPRNASTELSTKTTLSYAPTDLQSAAPAAPASRSSATRPGKAAQPKPVCQRPVKPEPDPWSRTLAALLQFNTPPGEFPDEFDHTALHPAPVEPEPATAAPDDRAFSVTVLEQLSNALVVIAWHDPTMCNYEEQVWAPALAKHAGWCALSGTRICRGDYVYKPRTRGPIAPLNGEAMILASVLQMIRDG